MFCSKCGSPVNEGEKFCSACGQAVETVPAQQSPAQPPEQPYGQQPLEQQQYATNDNEPKKSKKGLAVILTLVAVLAIAAVALFLWPGYLTCGANTMQMKFMSDNGQVFSDAFSGAEGAYDKDAADKPFDMAMKMTANVAGTSQNMDMNMAYDEEALGLSENLGVAQIKLLLLGDVLYIESSGQTTGIKFTSDEDLSKPMPLKERLTAILKGVVKDLGGNIPKTEVDWNKLLIMMVNSIDKSNFKQTGSEFTLTLDADALIATMKTFRDSLSKDEKLLEELESFIREINGQKTEVLKTLDDAIKSMEETKSSSGNFLLTWTVGYEGGKPKTIDITVSSAGQDVKLSFGYKDIKNGRDITLAVDSPGDTSDVKYDISYTKNGDTIDFTVTMDAAGQAIKMNGSMTKKGDSITGSVTMDAFGQTMNMNYDGTVKYGMPPKKVKDDDRFKVNIEGAQIYKVSDLLGMLGSGMLGSVNPIPGTIN